MLPRQREAESQKRERQRQRRKRSARGPGTHNAATHRSRMGSILCPSWRWYSRSHVVPGRRRREVFFTIHQDGMLDGAYNLIHRLSFTIRDVIERRMTQHLRTTYIKRTVQVIFGNVVDIGDHMDGHPGMNSMYIFRSDSLILLLETSHRVN